MIGLLYTYRYTEQILAIEASDVSEDDIYHAISDLTKSTPSLSDKSGLWLKDLYAYFQLPQQKETVRNGFIRTGIMDACIDGPQQDDPFI